MVLRAQGKKLVLAQALGVSEAAISRWGTEGKISLRHLVGLCRHLNVSADWLLLGEPPPDDSFFLRRRQPRRKPPV